MDVDPPEDDHVRLVRATLPEICDVVLQFCSVHLPQPEYDILANNPKLLDPAVAKALRAAAIRANARNDELLAYRLHRKCEIIRACIEQGGVNEFYRMLDDYEKSKEFFIRVGPPPGYDEDYFEQLEQLYYNGDTLKRNVENQVQYLLSMRNSAKFSLNLTEVDIENERKWIITKYSGNSTSTSLDSELHGIAALTPKALQQIQVQLCQRQILLNEFVHQQDGMKRMFNWLYSMLPVMRHQLLADAVAEVMSLQKETVFREVVNLRQMRLLVSELFHIELLLADDGQILFELFIKAALGGENSFVVPAHIAQKFNVDCQNGITVSNILESLHAAYNSMLPHATLQDLVIWLTEQQRRFILFPPAILFLEWLLEDAIIKNSPQLDPQIIERRPNFNKFLEPFLLLRTRIIQLLLLRLIEQCLQETITPMKAKKKKRKKA